MTRKVQIHEQGLEEYPKARVISGNLVMILWIVLGMIGCWFLHPLIAWLYLSFAVLMIGVILRKLLCTNCYYYDKWCCMGWGKLAAVFFKKGDIEKFNTNIGQKFAPLTYGFLTIIPFVSIVIALFQKFAIFKVIVLFLLLFISFYSGTVSRKKTCAICKMRLFCPGSAVK